jgi:hypothetical protein
MAQSFCLNRLAFGMLHSDPQSQTESAAWVGPRYEGGQYYVDYWNDGRGRVDHDHHWDNRHEKRERDHDRWHDHDHDHDNH